MTKSYQNFFEQKSIILNQSQQNAVNLLIEMENDFAGLNWWMKLFAKPKHHGVYLYGEVGRGKSLILNAFLEVNQIGKTRKFHFHKFMEFIHEEARKIRSNSKGDPINKIAKNLADKYRVICLDELYLSDISNAMIIGRLLRALLKMKIIVIITSNRHPKDLYLGGLQKEYFEDFADFIEQELDIFELKGENDYRERFDIGRSKVKFKTCENHLIDDMVAKITGNAPLTTQILQHKRHEIICPEASYDVAVFDFDSLCKSNFSASDYRVICQTFKWIVIKNIPKLSQEDRNEAKRFINLIDMAYENHNFLIFSTDVKLSELYVKGKNSFEFERTTSRLQEMQSEEWLK